MKRILFFGITLCMGAAAFLSCSKDEKIEQVSHEGTQAKNAIGIDVVLDGMSTRAQSGVVNAFESGDEIGVYATTGTLGSPYLSKASYNNVLWKYSSNDGWKCGSDGKGEMLLGNGEATLFAYYPYKADIDPTAIPVSLDETDYLYGQGDNNVSFANRNTKILMHHAMTQFNLRLVRGTYAKAGNITSVTLLNNNSKQNIVDGGKLNISTGAITGGTAKTLTVNSAAGTLPQSKTENVSFSRIMVPFPATQTDGEIVLQVNIDDETFYFELEKTTAFQAGHRHIYRATVNSSSLEIGKDDISVQPWLEETEKNASLSPLTE